MAIYILPLDVDQRNRSVGGSTFTANASGPVIRSRRMVRYTNSFITSRNKTNFRTVVSQWRTLTVGEKAQWNSQAAVTPFVNSLGVVYFISGFQLCVKVNLVLLRQGLPLEILPLPPLVPPTNLFTLVTFSYDPPELAISMEQSPPQPQWNVNLWFTPIVSAGKKYSFPDKFRYEGEFGLVDFQGSDYSGDYISQFGDFPDPSIIVPENSAIYLHVVWQHDSTKVSYPGDTIKAVYSPL